MTTRKPATAKAAQTDTAETPAPAQPTETVVVALVPDPSLVEATRAALLEARAKFEHARDEFELARDGGDEFDEDGEPIEQPTFSSDPDLNAFLLQGRHEVKVARLSKALEAADRAKTRAEKEHHSTTRALGDVGNRFAELVADLLNQRLPRVAREAGIQLGRITVESIPLDRGRTPTQDSRGDTFGKVRIVAESRHLPALVPHGFIEQALADVGARNMEGKVTSIFFGSPTVFEYTWEGSVGDPVVAAKAEEARRRDEAARLAASMPNRWSGPVVM